MSFNIGKCKVMHIGSRNLSSACYYINGHKLEECQEEKDLGVLVSNNLKMGPQCNHASQKANRILGLLKRMIDNKTPHIMLSLYKLLLPPPPYRGALSEYAALAMPRLAHISGRAA